MTIGYVLRISVVSGLDDSQIVEISKFQTEKDLKNRIDSLSKCYGIMTQSEVSISHITDEGFKYDIKYTDVEVYE